MQKLDKGTNSLAHLILVSRAVSRLSRFGVVGLVGAAVYYVALWIMVEELRLSVLVATSIAFLLVALENYVLHYVWTFKSTNQHAIALPRFLSMNLVGFFINLGIMFAGVEKLAFNYFLVQAVAIILVMCWNFSLSFIWIFRSAPIKQ